MGYGNQVTEEKLGRMFLVENQKQKKSIEVLVTMLSLPIMKIWDPIPMLVQHSDHL